MELIIVLAGFASISLVIFNLDKVKLIGVPPYVVIIALIFFDILALLVVQPKLPGDDIELQKSKLPDDDIELQKSKPSDGNDIGPQKSKLSDDDIELQRLQKEFFGFTREYPKTIEIVLPGVDRGRTRDFVCSNYPLFESDLATDDVYTSIEVHTLLASLYKGIDITVVECDKDNIHNKAPEKNLRILIGGKPTNTTSCSVLKEKYYRYHSEDGHIVVGPNGAKFEVKLDSSGTSIIRDYSFISRFTEQGSKCTDIILSGCRAYGQYAFYFSLLGNINFYREMSKKAKGKDFQAILPIEVRKLSPNTNIWKPNWNSGEIAAFQTYKRPFKSIRRRLSTRI